MNRDKNLYTLQKKYNNACEPIDWDQYNHLDCGSQDRMYEAYQERIFYMGEELENYEMCLAQVIDLYHEAKLEVEFWEQMMAAVVYTSGNDMVIFQLGYKDASISLYNAVENLSYYEARIKQEAGNSLSAMMEDLAYTGIGPKPRFERFHIYNRSDGFTTIYGDNDIPF